MPSIHRCLFGCNTTGVTIHSFPNPKKHQERFRTWVDLAGNACSGLTDIQIYNTRKVCEKHFADQYKNRNRRLNAIAIPHLFISSVLHKFPNPNLERDCFQRWVRSVGDSIKKFDDIFIFNNRRVCRRHFEAVFQYPKNRLSKLAIPTLFIQELAGHQHGFPNPDRFPERFKKWVQIVGGELNTPDDYAFYRKKRLCDRHFTVKDRNRCNRLNALAVPSLYVRTKGIIENSKSVKSEPASYLTDEDMEEDPLKITEDPLNITEDPILNTKIIEDVPSQTPEGISCLNLVMDVPSHVEEVTISCTSPTVDNSAPKPSAAQQALHTGSDVFPVLKDTYSKFKVPEKCNVVAPDSKIQVPEKSNVATCSARDLYIKDNAFVPLSDYKCQQHQIRLLKQQVRSLQKRCISYKNRLAQASKLKPSAAFQKVTKNMTEPAKIFTKMQFTQTHKKPAGRRFTSEEKKLSLSIYKKTNPQSYSFLAHCFTLPSIKTIKAMLAQEKLEPYLTLDKNATLPSNKTLVQERLEPYLTLDKNSTSPTKITLKDMLSRDNFEPYLTIEQNSSLPLEPCRMLEKNSTSPTKITLEDMLSRDNFEPYLTIEQNSSLPLEPCHMLEKNSTSTTKITPKDMLPKGNFKPYLTMEQNCSLPLEPFRMLDKNSTSPTKITLKDMLPKDNFKPYLTIEQNCSLPFRITLKDILAHKQLEPYLTFKKNSTSPSKKARAKEKPEPHRTLKKKSTLPSKKGKVFKGILAQEQLEPYLTFNKNSTKTYLGKGKARLARTEVD